MLCEYLLGKLFLNVLLLLTPFLGSSLRLCVSSPLFYESSDI